MLFATTFPSQVPIDKLDQLAHSRDVAELSAYLDHGYEENPFLLLKRGGAYVAGSLGWSAKPLVAPDGTSYVVFSTPIIEEDAGELLFQVNPEGKLVYVPESDDLGMSLDSHSFDLSFDLKGATIAVKDRVKCHWVGKPGGHYVFRLSPTLHVSAIADAQGSPLPFSQGGGIVAVTPEPGNDQVLTVSYSGNLNRPGFRRTITPNEACVSGAIWYPMIARHPATYDIAVHAPKEWTVLSQGEEVSKQAVGDEAVTRYKMDLPVVWFSTSAGPYRTVESDIGGRRYFTMSTTMTTEQMELQNHHSADVIELYSQKFWPYPFTRWTSLDSVVFRGGVGALEAYSFATYPGSPGQDAHEPSHTWWGGVVNNDYLRSFWNESFADFSMMYFQQERPIGSREERRQAYVFTGGYAPQMDEAPLANAGDFSGPVAALLGYVKGASVLQVLDEEIGPDVMSKALHEYIRSNPSRRIGSWEAFEAAVDKTTGKDYKWFFDEWVRQPGAPDFSLQGAAWKDGVLTGSVMFKGVPYRIHADLLLEFADGHRQASKVDILQTKIGDAYQFAVSCPVKPSTIALDPWQKIPVHAAGTNRLQIGGMLFQSTVVGDPARPSYIPWHSPHNREQKLPSDLADTFIIGSPQSLPEMKPLCDKVGFKVAGDKLTYKGTTIDLTKEGAIAIVDLPEGKHCLIGLGTSRVQPDFGRARLMLFDSYGRMLRGETAPVDTGPLAAKVGP